MPDSDHPARTHEERASGATPAVSPATPEDEPLSRGRVVSARTSVAPMRIPAAAEAVVARWNPQGMAMLEATRAESGAGPEVVLVAVDDANTALLRAELARFAPRIEVSEPVVEPSRPVGVALVLLDAGTPVGAHTLRVVGRLWADGTRIIFGLNGIHAHPEWQAVRERDLEVLRAVCPGDMASARSDSPKSARSDGQSAQPGGLESARPGGSTIEILPVSPQLGIAARNGGDAALSDRAGIGLLHARLAAATGAVSTDGRAAAVLERVLADTRSRIHDQIAVLRSGAELAALREERVTLLSVSDGGRAIAMATLHNRLQLARVDLVHEIGARVRSLNIAARADVERLGRTEQRDYPKLLQRSVNQLTADIDTEFLHRLVELAEVVEECMEPFDRMVLSARVESARAAESSARLPAEYLLGDTGLGSGAHEAEPATNPEVRARQPRNGTDPTHNPRTTPAQPDVSDSREMPAASGNSPCSSADSEPASPASSASRGNPPASGPSRPTRRPVKPQVGPGPEPRHAGVEDRLMIVVGASAGFGLGRLIVSPFALVPALDYATVPLTLLLGALVAGWLARARGQLADRAHLRQWIADALVNVKAQLEQRVAAVLVDAEDQLTDQVVRSATARMVEADRRVGEIEALLKASAARRPAQLAACERDIGTLDFE